ncbi:MAG: hypothetical protein KDC57_13710 [Saprospiraceae bacterium]|nr:hypothetical protein [Saprospiraceae bacterium]
MSNRFDLKNLLPHLGAFALFLALATFYFYPQLQGKVLQQGDILSGIGMSHEVQKYYEETGNISYWTDAMFGGMPTYQMWYPKSMNLFRTADKLIKAWISYPIGMFLGLMVVLYLSMLAFRVDRRVSLIMAPAFAFSIYFLLLIDAGHNSKINAISYFGFILAGLYLLLERRKYLWGAIVLAIGAGFELAANHIQMTYYYLLALLPFLIAFLIKWILEKSWGQLGKFAGYASIAAIAALLSGASIYLPTLEYQKDTMRGKPILSKGTLGTGANSSSETVGLDYTYATRWSNNIGDVFSSMVPNVVGGGNVAYNTSGTLASELRRRGFNAPKINLYWGGLDSTGGPAYFGVIVWLLFIVGIWSLRGPLQWGFMASMLFILLISLGKNAGFFNELLYNYLPLFNKFRAPSSAISVAVFLAVTGGALGLNELLFSKKKANEKLVILKRAGITLGAILGLILISGLFFFTFKGSMDSQFEQAGILDAVIDERTSLFWKSLGRSILFAGIAWGVLWYAIKQKWNLTYVAFGLGTLILVDLWGVGRQFVNNDSFVTAKQRKDYYTPRPVDQLILKDKDPDFRVFDLTGDPFNSSFASYFHKTIGGYHPAKLQRYQDLIDRYISQNHQPVLNMLNTKYYIVNDDQKKPTVQPNTRALGNVWFVDNYMIVETADQEFNGLNGLDPGSRAIIHKEFASQLEGFQPTKGGTISLTSYAPNRLVFSSDAPSEQLAVFSEIWYGPNKGWNAYVDGEPANLLRADYALRAMRVPAGQHTIEMRFEPSSVKIGKTISLITSGLLLLLFVGYLIYPYVASNGNPKKEKQHA